MLEGLLVRAVDASLAFFTAWLLCEAFLRLLRPSTSWVRQLALAAPPAKALSVLLLGIGPTFASTGATGWEQGTFQLGLGLSMPLAPVVHLRLGALVDGTTHVLSLGDLAVVAVRRLPLLWLVPALVLVVAAWRGSRGLLAFRPPTSHVVVGERPTWRGSVALSVDDSASVPHVTGWPRATIVLPRQLWQLLSAEEREAVTTHELAHLRFGHDILLGVLRPLVRTLWWVPGVRGWLRRVEVACEHAADDAWATRGDPTVLAMALLNVAEHVHGERPASTLEVMGHAPPTIARPGSVLAERVRRLVAGSDGPRQPRSWRRFAVGLIVLASLWRATLALLVLS